MYLTAEQLKGKIKNEAKSIHANAPTLLRLYMMERFLERVSLSPYRERFVVKGGILVTALVGVALRSTMDIDASLKNFNLSEKDAAEMIHEIIRIPLKDDVNFAVKDVIPVMDQMEYPGIRITLEASLEKLIVPLKIDISTGDAITPSAVEYRYKLLLEDRNITLWSYNTETVLAEKVQTILARGILNTRMRDFYDIRILWNLYENKISADILQNAFSATCRKRKTPFSRKDAEAIAAKLETDSHMRSLWEIYRKKYPYAETITYEDAITSLKELLNALKLQ